MDADGDTTNIEHLLRSGVILLHSEEAEIETKYRHLAPVGYHATPLGMFEYRYEVASKGTSQIEEQLRSGDNILAGWPEEVEEKYGYLVDQFLDRVKEFEKDYLYLREGETVMRRCSEKGMDIFENKAPEVIQKYGYLKQYYKPENAMDLADD